MKKFLLVLVVLFQAVFAQNFDFTSNGNCDANDILRNYIENKYNIEDVDVCAYNYNGYIFGIVKSNIFYSLEGYKLVILKKQDNDYVSVKSNIFFDNSKEFDINDNKITFYKSYFYKNKKCSALIRENEVKTIKTIGDNLTDRKVKNIQKLTVHTKNEKANNIELTDFKVNSQRNVNIKYNNLNEKTRHYIEMR